MSISLDLAPMMTPADIVNKNPIMIQKLTLDLWVSKRRDVLGAGLGLLCAPMASRAASFEPVDGPPSELRHLVENLALAIYRGKLVRQLYMTKELENRLYSQELVPNQELQLTVAPNGNPSHASFFEITRAVPLMVSRNAKKFRLAYGTIYIQGVSAEEQQSIYEKLIGRELVFLFNGLGQHGKNGNSFPSPIFNTVSHASWRDSIPRGLAELPAIEQYAMNAGFIRIG